MLDEEVIGTPESCDHHFCLECIEEWAKVKPNASHLRSYTSDKCSAYFVVLCGIFQTQLLK